MAVATNSHKTAITRKGPSAPCRWLCKQGKLIGATLDWGCGKGADCKFLGCEGYDPHYRPELPLGVFDTITCTYVLNTLSNYHDRCLVVEQCVERLKSGGWLYVTIRSKKNIPKDGYTKLGTWQGYVGNQLELGGFTLLHKTSDFEIWGWKKCEDIWRYCDEKTGRDLPKTGPILSVPPTLPHPSSPVTGRRPSHTANKYAPTSETICVQLVL